MRKAGMSKILNAAAEGVAVARGEVPAARITIKGHTYVPLNMLEVSEAANRAKTELLLDIEAMLKDEALTPSERVINVGLAIAVRLGPP